MQSAGDGAEGNTGVLECCRDDNQGTFCNDSGAETCLFRRGTYGTNQLGLHDDSADGGLFREAARTDVAKIRLKWYNFKDYNNVKEGENDVKTEDSEKTEEGKAGENASQGTGEAYVAQREKA